MYRIIVVLFCLVLSSCEKSEPSKIVEKYPSNSESLCSSDSIMLGNLIKDLKTNDIHYDRKSGNDGAECVVWDIKNSDAIAKISPLWAQVRNINEEALKKNTEHKSSAENQP